MQNVCPQAFAFGTGLCYAVSSCVWFAGGLRDGLVRTVSYYRGLIAWGWICLFVWLLLVVVVGYVEGIWGLMENLCSWDSVVVRKF